jgi:hypothetical protein
MSKKDEASPRQRQIMEARWAKARAECPAGTCVPSSRFHVAGCTRRTNRMVTLAPEQKVTVTNLNTGETSKAATVREGMDANDKQAILLEPVIALTQEEVDSLAKEDRLIPIPQEMHFPQEAWTPFEKGQRAELFEPRIQPRQDQRLVIPAEPDMPLPEPAPARPWWKFWGRRG